MYCLYVQACFVAQCVLDSERCQNEWTLRRPCRLLPRYLLCCEPTLTVCQHAQKRSPRLPRHFRLPVCLLPASGIYGTRDHSHLSAFQSCAVLRIPLRLYRNTQLKLPQKPTPFHQSKSPPPHPSPAGREHRTPAISPSSSTWAIQTPERCSRLAPPSRSALRQSSLKETLALLWHCFRSRPVVPAWHLGTV